MILKENIKDLIGPYLENHSLFLVDIEINAENDIEVTVESEDSLVELEDCVQISKIVEQGLDREMEDFSLTVTSAGLDRPFKVLKQYLKYVGKEVEVVLKNGLKYTALISSADESGIWVCRYKLEKVENKKRKEKVEIKEHVSYNEMKSVKPKINI